MLGIVGDQPLILELLFQLEILEQFLLQIESLLELGCFCLHGLSLSLFASRQLLRSELGQNRSGLSLLSVPLVPSRGTRLSLQLHLLAAIGRVHRDGILDIDFVLQPIHSFDGIVGIVALVASLTLCRTQYAILHGRLVLIWWELERRVSVVVGAVRKSLPHVKGPSRCGRHVLVGLLLQVHQGVEVVRCQVHGVVLSEA